MFFQSSTRCKYQHTGVNLDILQWSPSPPNHKTSEDAKTNKHPTNNRRKLGLSIIVVISLLFLCDYFAFPNDVFRAPSIPGGTNRGLSLLRHPQLVPLLYDSSTIIQFNATINGADDSVVAPSIIVDELPVCGMDDSYAIGTWRYIEEPSPAPYDLGDTDDGFYTNLCSLKSPPHGLGDYRNHLKWIPENCRMQAFDKENFCKALNGRSVLFVGDSLSVHMATSLYNLIKRPQDLLISHDEFNLCEGSAALDSPSCHKARICQDYYPDDARIEIAPLKVWTLEKEYFQTALEAWKEYGLVIINFGAHYFRLNVTPEAFQEHLNNIQEFLQTMMTDQKKMVLYRSANEGHSYDNNAPHCDEAGLGKGPMSVEEFGSWKSSTLWGWNKFPLYNAIAKPFFENLGASYLDVRRLTIMYKTGFPGSYISPDAERGHDCLHHCIPGVYDVWNQLLLNIMMAKGGVPAL